MPAKREWTADEIERLRELTIAGVGSPALAVRFGVSQQYIRVVRRKLGVDLPEVLARRRNAHMPQRDDPVKRAPERIEPLRAGHSVSWGAITVGTVLEGEVYRG